MEQVVVSDFAPVFLVRNLKKAPRVGEVIESVDGQVYVMTGL